MFCAVLVDANVGAGLGVADILHLAPPLLEADAAGATDRAPEGDH